MTRRGAATRTRTRRGHNRPRGQTVAHLRCQASRANTRLHAGRRRSDPHETSLKPREHRTPGRQNGRIPTQWQRGDQLRASSNRADSPPPVVLLAGWPVTTYHWRFTIPELERAGFPVLPITLPGLGGTPAPTGGTDKLGVSRAVLSTLDEFEVDQFVVVGHDWGGTVGCLLARNHPSRVAALVVTEEILPGIDVEIPEPGKSHYPRWHSAFNEQPGLAELILSGGREETFLSMFLTQSAGPKGLPPEAMDRYVGAYAGEAFTIALRYYRTAHEDNRAVLGYTGELITQPVLAIGGEFGMGRAVGEGMKPLARNVHYVEIAEAGHYPAEQNPDLFSNTLIAFLQGLA
ncbi:alpha/beta fold hydrolase [Actinokineospora sp. HUAS TT18]|uniref:alpha/beta fold hydrolase n=1 Tax=Actinokineospora sp. HUAS TT18 TaxID=3447451 RepID=UPI003F52000E